MPRVPLPQVTYAPVPFPLRGVDAGQVVSAQPPETTADAQNVRAFDVFADRSRGGSRPGLSRYIDQRLPL